MKKGYSYRYFLLSEIYGYEINTTYFEHMLNGMKNVYITSVCDKDRDGHELVEIPSFSKDSAEMVHIDELRKCINGFYDNYVVLICDSCHGSGYIYKDGNWHNYKDSNIIECKECKGKGYEVLIPENISVRQ